jgi:hypothetical protein
MTEKSQSIDNPDSVESEIVCLCGSTKYKQTFEDEIERLTFEGCITVAPGVFGHADGIDLSDQEKQALDRLHREKVLISDRVHVVNVNGYVGDSTEAEIKYAKKIGTPVTWYDDSEVPEIE